MTTFNQQNKKLQKIFNDIKKNKSSLDNNKNEQLLLNFFKTNISPHFTIEDTGWIAKTLSIGSKTINKGNLVPKSFSINYVTEIGIPDFFFPYIDVNVLINTTPGSVLITYDKFSTKKYTGNYINVQGVDGLIYKGIYPAPPYISTSNLGTVVLEANTKKVWGITVFHTDPNSGDNFTTSGELLQISMTENTEVCEKETDPGPPPEFTTITIKDTFNCSPFSITSHKLLDFDEEGFTGIGDFTNEFFTSESPNCDVSSTTEETTLSKSFSAVEGYKLYVDGSQTNRTNSTTTRGAFFVRGSDITGYDRIIFRGHQPYYSSLLKKKFKTSGLYDIVLNNVPDNSSITLQRNLEPLSTILATKISESSGESFIRKEFAFFKMQDENSNNIPYYYLKIRVGAIILAPAIVSDPSPNIITQSDIYNNGVRTTNNIGRVSEAYISEGQDVQYRLMIIVKNPFWYQEVRKYGTSE